MGGGHIGCCTLGTMLGGQLQFQVNKGVVPLRSRKSMLETLLRRLDMVRLTITAATLILALGCSGLIDDGGNGDLSAEEARARLLFTQKAIPALEACRACHDAMLNIDFLAGGSDLEIRDRVLSYEPAVINLDATGSSRILTKGQHQGPPLDAIQTSDLLEWLQAEREAAGVGGTTDPALRTVPVLIQICQSGQLPNEVTPNPLCPINNIPLDTVGEGSAGSRVSFVVVALSSGLYLTNMKIVPGATGVFAEHPLFVAFGDDGITSPRSNCETLDEATGAVACADTLDRFFNVKANMMTGAPIEEQLLAGGAHTFVNFRPTDRIAIHFRAVKIFQPGSGPPVALGCKRLDPEFKAARAAFNANVGAGAGGQNCAQCHAGANGNATATMNLSQINSADDTQLLTTCNNVRSRMNLQGIDASSLFLAVDPANANHPVRFDAGDFQSFKNLITPWAIAERDAP